jgi:hypothetical protein
MYRTVTRIASSFSIPVCGIKHAMQVRRRQAQ